MMLLYLGGVLTGIVIALINKRIFLEDNQRIMRLNCLR